MELPMADLMSDSETIAPDKFILRIEVLVNQYEFFLKPNRTENIWLTPQHRRIKDLVEVGKAELQREMRGGDIGDRYWQPNPLPDRLLVFGKQRFRFLLNCSFSQIFNVDRHLVCILICILYFRNAY
jgi:hypothetical protein